MKDVFFKPWVGANYGQKDSIFEQKILVLGDSHYADEGDIADGYDGSCDFTTGVMHDYLDQSILNSTHKCNAHPCINFVRRLPAQAFSRA